MQLFLGKLNTTEKDVYGCKAACSVDLLLCNTHYEKIKVTVKIGEFIIFCDELDVYETMTISNIDLKLNQVIKATGTDKVTCKIDSAPESDKGMEIHRQIKGDIQVMQPAEFNKTSTHIQWRYIGATVWNDLVPLVEIKGDTGNTGATGPQGSTGPQGPQGEPGTTDYNELQNVPSTFPPSAHNHALNSLSEKSYNSLTEKPDLSSLHSHGNKALLDTYTQTEANIADAVSKKHTHSNQTALDAVSGTNTGDSSTPAETTTTIGNLINGATAKTTPVDADNVSITDSAASHILKKVTWANVKATLKTYFDTLYWTPVYTVLANDTLAQNFATNTCNKLTVTANRTLTTNIPAAGRVVRLIILTSGTTSFTITFGSGFKPTGTLATGTTNNRVFVITFISDGTNLYEAGRTTAMAA